MPTISIEQFEKAEDFSAVLDLLVQRLQAEVMLEQKYDIDDRHFTPILPKIVEQQKLYKEFGEDIALLSWCDSRDPDIKALYDACDSGDYGSLYF